MKLIIYAATLLVVCAWNTNAVGQNLRLEIIGGPALTSIRDSGPLKSKYKPITHFTTGVGLTYRIREKSHLNIKLLFEKRDTRAMR